MFIIQIPEFRNDNSDSEVEVYIVKLNESLVAWRTNTNRNDFKKSTSK